MAVDGACRGGDESRLSSVWFCLPNYGRFGAPLPTGRQLVAMGRRRSPAFSRLGGANVPCPIVSAATYRTLEVCGLLLFLATALAGCGGNAAAVAAENDRLRRELLDTQKQLDAAMDRASELEVSLRSLADRPEGVSAEVFEATPRVQEIEIDRLSHARDSDGDGYAESIIVYVRPLDGRGRFLQIAGEVTVVAAVLPADQNAITIARQTFTPAAVRDAYRSGITGTHYTFELPIDPTTATDQATCTARVTFADPLTGVEHDAQREIELP